MIFFKIQKAHIMYHQGHCIQVLCYDYCECLGMKYIIKIEIGLMSPKGCQWNSPLFTGFSPGKTASHRCVCLERRLSTAPVCVPGIVIGITLKTQPSILCYPWRHWDHVTVGQDLICDVNEPLRTTDSCDQW